MPPDEDEPLHDPIADLDQSLRAIGDVAKMVREFYLSLLREGFNDPQALALTGKYVVALMGGQG